MSVPLPPRDLSIRYRQPWIIVIIFVLMIWSPVAEAVRSYVDAAAFVALASAGCHTAAKYSNRNRRERPSEAL